MFFSFKPKPTLLRSPSLLKLQLLMLKVVATTLAEALRHLLEMMAAWERAAREEMPAAVVGATDRAPAAEDQATGGSSHPAAGEV